MADSPRSIERSVRLYRALLRAYPASFRQEYGDEMTLVFRELAVDAWRRRGRIGLWLIWLRVLGDLLRSSPREHVAQWTRQDGGTAVKIKTLLGRQLTTDETDRRWGQIVVFVMAILIPIPALHKWTTLHLTATQWTLGSVAIALLSVQICSYGLLFSIRSAMGWSRLRHDVYQIMIYMIVGPAMVLGIWRLRSMAASEFEFMLGFVLLADAAIGATFFGSLLGMIRSSKANRDQSASAQR
jgi:hypothetical protein